MFQFLVGVCTEHTGDQRAGTGPGNHPWQQVLLEHDLDHPEVVETQDPSPAQHQRRAAEAHVGAIKEVELLLHIDLVAVQLREETQGVIDLVDILLDEALGPGAGARVQAVVAHPAHVAVNTLVEGEQQALVVLARAQAADAVQAQSNLRVVVLAALVDLPPALLSGELVVLPGRLQPHLVGVRLAHAVLHLLEFARFYHLLCSPSPPPTAAKCQHKGIGPTGTGVYVRPPRTC